MTQIYAKIGCKVETTNWKKIHVCVCSVLSNSLRLQWTMACQAPLSVEFSRQEYWSGLPFPSRRWIFLTRGSNLHVLRLLPWQVDSLPVRHLGSPPCNMFIWFLSEEVFFCFFLHVKTMEEVTKEKHRFGFINLLNFCKSKHNKHN